MCAAAGIRLGVVSSSDRATTGLRHGRVDANGIEFGFLEAGSGALALCLHGFPDSAYIGATPAATARGGGLSCGGAYIAGMRQLRSPPMAATSSARSWPTLSRCTRRWTATSRRSSSDTTGEPRPLTARPRCARALAAARDDRHGTPALDERIFGDYQQLKRSSISSS